MLTYNFQRVFTARGIDKPRDFLIKNGFPRGIASRIATNKVGMIPLKHLEKVCLLLNCTPNDLLEWQPARSGSGGPAGKPAGQAGKKEDSPDTALYILKREQQSKGEAELLRGLPLSKLEELAKVLRENPDSSR